MAEKIRVGIVGASPTRGWALDTHLPALHGLPDFEIVAVATTRLESAEETARNWNVPHAYGDSAELFADPDVDVAVISVKVPYHFDLVRAALEANKHVVCEWPLGVNAKEAEILADLAASKGLQNVIGLQGRMSPIGNYVRHLVAEGYVGEMRSVSVRNRSRGGPAIPAVQAYTTDRDNGANTLTIAGGHCIDFLRYLVGDLDELQALLATRNPVVRLVETGEELSMTSPEVVLAEGRLVAGAYATIDLQSGPEHLLGSRVHIEGSDGVLLIDSTLALHGTDDTLTLTGAKVGEQLHPLEVPPSFDQVPLTVPTGRPRNTAGLYLALAAALAGGGHAKPDFADALSLHQLLEAIEAASTTGPPRKLR
jgi:predicted dehydrogenase